MPEGHPPIDGAPAESAQADQLAGQAQQIMARLAQSPDDPRLMVALANVFYDGKRWAEARTWYEKGLEKGAGNADVVTDLAVVYRNLGQPERSIELLDQAIGLEADHWQAWHNKAVIFHFDLHRHEDAARVLERLDEIRAILPEGLTIADPEGWVDFSTGVRHAPGESATGGDRDAREIERADLLAHVLLEDLQRVSALVVQSRVRSRLKLCECFAHIIMPFLL